MKLPFKLPFFRKRKLNKTLINNEVTENVNVAFQTIDEKEALLRNLDFEQLETLFFRTGLNRDTISLEFAKKLVDSPTLLNYLVNNVFEKEIILKINDGNLRISDIKRYDKTLFSYDVFYDGDKKFIDILRRKVSLLDSGYANFSLEEFENSINSNNYVESNIESFINDVSLLTERKKALKLPQNNFYNNDDISIFHPIDSDKVFCENIFDFYYSKDLSYTKDTILFISYDKFLEWLKDNNKREILKNVQVVINDDYNKSYTIIYAIKDFKNASNWSGVNNNYYDKMLIKVNHLLYLVENSELDNELKDYYKYNISNTFLAINKDGFSYWYYQLEDKLRELANEIRNKLDDGAIIKITNNFNELNIEEKNKNVEQYKFSAEIFLRQFSNLEEMSSFGFLGYISSLNDEEKNEVLSNEIVINKLRGLLEESSNDQYRWYEQICNRLSVSDIFKIFDSSYIKDFFKRHRTQVQYRFFFVLTEKNANEVIEHLLGDEEFFREFAKDLDRYDFSKLNYDLLVKLLKQLEQTEIKTDSLFFSGVDTVNQFKLLKEDFGDDFLVKVVGSLSREVQQFFYLEDKRFNYLWDKFYILGLIRANYQISNDVVNKPEFLDNFKSISMIQFRANVNQFLIHQADHSFEERIIKYEDDLINSFDVASGMFVKYKELLDNISLLEDRKFISPGIDFFYDAGTNYDCRQFIGYDEEDRIFIKDKVGLVNYLKHLSKIKLNEIVVDRLFKDNIYNMFLNIKEMLRYNKGLIKVEKVLSEEQEEFYNTILNIDKLDYEVVLKIYNEFKDKNVALMFYEDLQKVKNKAYNKIKEDMFNPEDNLGSEDIELSNKYGIPIFDLRNKNYTMLARCLGNSHREIGYNRRDCYTILSNENSKVMSEDNYIYGYSDFDNDCVLHMAEGDSFSGDIKNNDLSSGSNLINRIMTSHEIVTNSSWYSEIQIVNKRSEENKGMFETLRPSFLIVYDEIDDKTLNEAKRKNIPICIITHSLNKEVIGQFSTLGAPDEVKYTNEWGMINEGERRKNR